MTSEQLTRLLHELADGKSLAEFEVHHVRWNINLPWMTLDSEWRLYDVIKHPITWAVRYKTSKEQV